MKEKIALVPEKTKEVLKKIKKKKIKIKKPTQKTKKQVTKLGAIILILILMIFTFQYVLIKWQMSKYELPYYVNIDDYREYACVQMSYDAEQGWESVGFHVVQRRVEGVHRWIAVELLPGWYVDFESTLNVLGMHAVSEEMHGKDIFQSEGFFVGAKEIVHIGTTREMHGGLTDWEKIGVESTGSNLNLFSWI